MIISCDTSSVVCSVAVTHGNQVLSTWEESGGQIHIEKLSPFLKEALALCELHVQDLEALAIAIGPGSFNGLRIGLATMKALALTLDLPLIPISTTDALAYGLKEQVQGRCRAVIFSHRNFVHYADYNLHSESIPYANTYHYDKWDELSEKNIDAYFGTADRGFADWLQGEGTAVANRFHEVKAQAALVGLLAEFKKNDPSSDIDELEPFYNATYEAKKWVPPHF